MLKYMISHRGVIFLKILLVAVTAYLPCSAFYDMCHGKNPGEVIGNGALLISYLYLFGLVSSSVFSGIAASNFTDFLLYPKRYIKHPPLILSRVQGLIHRGNFEQAECELLQMRSDNPSSPELALLLAELHANCMNNKKAAVADCIFYFRNRKFRRHELNLQILFLYAEWMCDHGQHKEAGKVLLKDSRRLFYTAPERQKIKTRAVSLLRKQSSEK